MKKFNVYLVTILLFCFASTALFAQMKVTSTGLVRIGNSNEALSMKKGLCVDADSVMFRSGSSHLLIRNVSGALPMGGRDISNYEEPYNPRKTEVTGNPLSKVYIGTTGNPTYRIYVDDIYQANMYTLSDLRIKENINSIEAGLSKVLQLQPVTYNLKQSSFPKSDTNQLKDKSGFIAQQVMSVIPSAAGYIEESDMYTIEYNALIPYLVKAIQELSQTVEEQSLEIAELSSLAQGGSGIQNAPRQLGGENGSTKKENKLYQNSPNPFSVQTEIKYDLGTETPNAFIYIYNLQGEQKKAYTIDNTGTLTIRANELNPGMYLYTMVVEGKIIGTKRMIVTQ